MKYTSVILLWVLGTVFSSCHEKHSVFEEVASDYASKGEMQKRDAALWLGRYAGCHYGIMRRMVPEVDARMNGVNADTTSRRYLDSVGCSMLKGEPVWDKTAVTKEYLRENIDLAFDSWRQPWAKDISFMDFCRYVLPYRNGDECLTDWRLYFKNKYERTIPDSVNDLSSISEVSQYLLRCLRREVAYGPRTGRLTQNSLLSPSEMERLHWLDCKSCAHYTALAMRACGIPCEVLEIHWRFTEVVHYSVLFPAVGNNPRAFRMNIGDELQYMGEPKDSMAAWRVWGYSFEINDELQSLWQESFREGDESKYLRSFALPLTREDVTGQFCSTFDFSMPVPDSLRGHKYLFLCRFYQWKWLPVREGQVHGDSVYFRDATIRQWYRLGVMSSDSVCTFGGTFTLLGDSMLADTRHRIRPYDLSGDTVLFKRVYPCDSTEMLLKRRMTTYYWKGDCWQPYTGDAVLWGFNKKTGEYRVFDEGLRPRFIPVFHLLQLRLPCWTVFTDGNTPRPLGFISSDPVSHEGYFMEF